MVTLAAINDSKMHMQQSKVNHWVSQCLNVHGYMYTITIVQILRTLLISRLPLASYPVPISIPTSGSRNGNRDWVRG